MGGFDWDDGNWPKCAKHGLSKAEIEYTLSHTPMVQADRTGGDEIRFNAIGHNEAGRYLFIVFAIRDVEGDRLIRPISARYMHRKEIEHYDTQKGA